ncbi:MAG: radical SAM protein [Nitrospirae bacterium]|nr:radical SAM protein [Nitrospirota bacterium]
MYENLTGAEHHSAIVDVTDRCNLRCKHCFYYREEHESEEIDTEEFLAGMKILQERHKIVSMGWCGGEPTYRPQILERGAKLFQMNQLFTNGTLPIPKLPGLIPFVSLDGTRGIHDQVRGRGSYDKTMKNLGESPIDHVVFQATFHRMNEGCLETMVEDLRRIEKPASVSFLVLLFTPLRQYETVRGYKHTETQKNVLDFSWEERDRFIDRLVSVKKKHPDLLLNSEVVLELMKSETAKEITPKCNMPRRTLTLDLKLNRKLPCVLGSEVDCDKCGCPFPYEQEARRKGLKPKTGGLNLPF